MSIIDGNAGLIGEQAILLTIFNLVTNFCSNMELNMLPEGEDFFWTLQLRGWQVSEEDRDHEGARLSVTNHIQEVLKDAMVGGLGEVTLQVSMIGNRNPIRIRH